MEALQETDPNVNSILVLPVSTPPIIVMGSHLENIAVQEMEIEDRQTGCETQYFEYLLWYLLNYAKYYIMEK